MRDAFYADVPDEVLQHPAGKPMRPGREAPQNAATLLLIASLFPVAVLGFPLLGALLLATGATSIGPPPDAASLDTRNTQADLELPERNLSLTFARVTLIRSGERCTLQAELPDGGGVLRLECAGEVAPGGTLSLVAYDWMAQEPPTLALPERNLVLLADTGDVTVRGLAGDTIQLEIAGSLQVFGVERFEDARTGLRTRAATGAQAPRGGKQTPFTLTAAARYAE